MPSIIWRDHETYFSSLEKETREWKINPLAITRVGFLWFGQKSDGRNRLTVGTSTRAGKSKKDYR